MRFSSDFCCCNASLITNKFVKVAIQLLLCIGWACIDSEEVARMDGGHKPFQPPSSPPPNIPHTHRHTNVHTHRLSCRILTVISDYQFTRTVISAVPPHSSIVIRTLCTQSTPITTCSIGIVLAATSLFYQSHDWTDVQLWSTRCTAESVVGVLEHSSTGSWAISPLAHAEAAPYFRLEFIQSHQNYTMVCSFWVAASVCASGLVAHKPALERLKASTTDAMMHLILPSSRSY